MTTTFQINSKLGEELAITDTVQAAVRFVVPDVSAHIAVQLCMVSWVIPKCSSVFFFSPLLFSITGERRKGLLIF